MFNDRFPWEAPFITCLETVEGTTFLKNEVMTFDNFRYLVKINTLPSLFSSAEPWDQSIKVLTILLSIQSYMASIKKEIPRSETYCSNSEEESDPQPSFSNRPPPLEAVPQDRTDAINERINVLRVFDSHDRLEELRNAQLDPAVQGKIREPRNAIEINQSGKGGKTKRTKSKPCKVSGNKAPSKRASTSKTSLEPASKKILKDKQALQESSQIGEPQAVDEKIKAARLKETVHFL